MESAMRAYNIHDAKTHLSRLVEQAAAGEPFVIAKAGKPMVVVSPVVQKEAKPPQRRGFLAGQIDVPDDFDEMFADEIDEMFGLKE
jgi:prevent-host-death family protein